MTTQPINRCYGIRVGRHAGIEIDLEAFCPTTEQACNAALAWAQNAFSHWRPGLPYGDLYVERLVNLTDGGVSMTVPDAYRSPAVGLTHDERQVVLLALQTLIEKIEAGGRPSFPAAAGQAMTNPSLEVAALRALAGRFSY